MKTRRRFAALARGLWADESGATMLEYVLMIAFVAAACLAAVTTFGLAVKGGLGTATSSI